MGITGTGAGPGSVSKRAWLAALAYLGLGLAFFPGVLRGWVVSAADVLYFFPPWDVLRPEGLEAPSNRMLTDQTREFLVFFHVARESFLRGEWPLWNPYIFCGTPLLANMQSALLYPLNVVHYLAPVWGFTFASLAKPVIAGTGLFVLARALGVSGAGAWLGGALYAFAAFNVFWLNHPHTNVTALFPWVLLLSRRLALAPDRRGVALLGFVVALQLLGGHVEIAFLTALAAGVWFLWHVVADAGWRPVARRGAALAGAYLLGLGLAGLVVIPFIEFLAHSATWHVRHEQNVFVLPWAQWLSLVHPDLLDVPRFGGMAVLFRALSLYTGVLTPVLAGFALAAGSPRRARVGWVAAAVVLAVFGLLPAFGVEPVFSVLTALPLLRETPAFYFVVFPVLALCLLGARGADAFLGRRITLHRHLLFWGLLLAAGVGLAQSDTLVAGLARALGAGAPAPRFGGELLEAGLPWLAALVLLALLGPLRTRHRGAVTGVLLLAAVAPLWLFQRHWNPVIPADWVLPDPPGVLRELAERDGVFRVAGIAPTLRTNTGALAGLQDVRGYDVPVVDRYHRFFLDALGGNEQFWRYGFRRHDPRRLGLLGLVNVRYLLSLRPLDGRLVPEPRRDGVVVNENPGSLDRAWFVPRAVTVAGPAEALARVTARGFDPAAEVVLETPWTAPGDPATGVVGIDHYSARRVEVSVEATGEGFLVLADTWYPGWVARVDGVDAPVLRADYLLRAVPVPAGRHRVSLRYEPASFRAGAALSIVSLLVSLWLLRKRAKSS